MKLAFASCLVLLAAASAKAPEVSLLAYIGGSGTDDCDGVTTDHAGDVYLACHSDSPDFPGTHAKTAPLSRVAMDAVVVKIDARTGRLAWVTRFGGSDWDAVGDIVVTRDGFIYALGSTRSADFPTTPDAAQRRFGGPERDGILVKLDSKGKVVYSTFLGGSNNDEPTTMSVAEDGTVYIGGVTRSTDFPGSHIAKFGAGGDADGFLVRLHPGDPSGLQTLIFGGSKLDHISGIALDRSGNIFVSGFTRSADFPVKNSVQPHFGGLVDAFLMKLRIADWSLLFSTFLGGSKLDGADQVAVDSSGNPVVKGLTESEDFPSTLLAFQPRLRGSVDAFVTKFSADGKQKLWSTFYGGSKANSDQFLGGSLEIDPAGRIWFTGMTNSPDLPRRNPLQAAYGGGDFDGFLAGLSSDGSKLCYGSYFGGNGHDTLEGLAIGNGKIYASGISSSTNLMQKRSQIQRSYGGGPYDTIVVGLSLSAGGDCH
jgi:Beta-propeller repeat